MTRHKSASAKSNNGLDKVPRPEGHLFTIEAVSRLVGRSKRTIYNVLSVHADKFGDPMYQKGLGNKGRRFDERLYRVLPASDMRVIRELFPIYVKRKAR